MEIMELVPDYYDEFHCIGSECKYNCCQEWPIEFNKTHYKRLRSLDLPEADRKVLLKTVKVAKGQKDPRRYAYVALKENGACGFQTDEGLCRLQQLAGETQLPPVCRTYPRLNSLILERVIEKNLRPECEAVVKQLMKKKEGIGFETRPTTEPMQLSRHVTAAGKQSDMRLRPNSELFPGDYRINSSEVVHNPFLPFYFDIKTLCIGILQNRYYTFHQRLLYMGTILRVLQKLEAEGRAADAAAVIAAELEREYSEQIAATMDKLPQSDAISMGWLMNLAGIAPMRGLPAYRKELAEAVKALEIRWNGETFVASASAYAEGKRLFDAYCVENPHFMENIAVALFQRLCMPFGGIYNGFNVTVRRDLWKNYRLFCGYLATVQFMLRARFLAGVPNDDDLARLVAVVFRRFPNRDAMVKKFEEEMTPGVDADPLEIISILIK